LDNQNGQNYHYEYFERYHNKILGPHTSFSGEFCI
jgi:hypothetical protein